MKLATEMPSTIHARRALLQTARGYVARHKLMPPLSAEELAAHCQAMLDEGLAQSQHLKYLAVLLNNELWRESLAAVPFNRRLLLLPKCLRSTLQCTATVDEFGLLCQGCGRCHIGKLRAEAQALGYVVLVAEGAAVVMSLVATGQIEAIIGVSCLPALERIFPCIEAAGVPAVAIPLLFDGCKETELDIDWVWEALHLRDDRPLPRVNMESMRKTVESWFAPVELEAVLGRPADQTEQIAQQWLARSGKRWRPFLAMCSFQAFQEYPLREKPLDARKIALAVECFHKASLIHDDIEDNDELRYGLKTLHEEYGLAIALNVGDYLLGEGYRMIAESAADSTRKERMLHAAVAGHRSLCAGQGEELLWMRNPRPLSVKQVLDIFRRKTAPAFEVALHLGAIYAGCQQAMLDVLSRFSQALGVAYQIRDDIEDFAGGGDGEDLKAMRPSVLLALAYQDATGESAQVLEAAWRRQHTTAKQLHALQAILEELSAFDAAKELLEEYRQQAILSLREIDNPMLKALLRRVVTRIFGAPSPVGA